MDSILSKRLGGAGLLALGLALGIDGIVEHRRPEEFRNVENYRTHISDSLDRQEYEEARELINGLEELQSNKEYAVAQKKFSDMKDESRPFYLGLMSLAVSCAGLSIIFRGKK